LPTIASHFAPKIFCALMITSLALSTPSLAQPADGFADSERFDWLFTEAGTQGTMGILRESDGKPLVVNAERARMGRCRPRPSRSSTRLWRSRVVS
jgi:hypothetical protein